MAYDWDNSDEIQDRIRRMLDAEEVERNRRDSERRQREFKSTYHGFTKFIVVFGPPFIVFCLATLAWHAYQCFHPRLVIPGITLQCILIFCSIWSGCKFCSNNLKAKHVLISILIFTLTSFLMYLCLSFQKEPDGHWTWIGTIILSIYLMHLSWKLRSGRMRVY
jgi:hypothetical protein